ncbi:integrator complex subunit 4-like [Ylistrum balloti]|uniref:integrator complex subunit 4-like n=1 Tax=Ylistrum balloti TaxID=509963 RepID=UPI002905893B|nr:integrator complex subunit 4-like [Ylistrum balloti]
MAALLKKRAVAEFSQVIQEEPKPVKRLKLIQRPPPQEISLDLEGATSTYDTLQRLLTFEESFPVRGEDVTGVVRELLDHYPREKEAVLRWKVASLLARLVQLPGYNAEALTDDIIRLLKTEKSNKAISQLVEVLRKIGMSSPYNTSLHHQLIITSKQYLRNTGHIARCSCLDLIGDLGSPDQLIEDSNQSGSNNMTIQKLLMGFTQDHDPRVRSRAFQAMLQFHQRGLPLGEGIYQHACSALTDDYRGVRLAAIKLVWVLSHLYPESLIPVPDSDEKLRLVDDGFTKICNMINDISMIVRVEAATLLGSLHQVSPKFLEQTLDKKLMSNMRKKESAHERAKEHFSSGQWATGQKWADDAPKEEVDPDAVSLMNIGACGAFVHGLEDEFLEVRNASLDSLCELAVQSPSFAALSQDSVIDMFNDEIKSVRLNAINSLRKLSHLLTLREDQLEIILGVLQDFSGSTREALRNMLCEMRLATKECLNTSVMSLLDNLRRYPQDKLSVWRCMQHLGKHHAHLILPLVPELLCLHPYFDTPEPDMEDPAYISILLLVFNSAVNTPTMMPMFQGHVWRHYHYLKESVPDMLPVLQVPGKIYGETVQTERVKSDSNQFVQQSLRQLENIGTMDLNAAHGLLEMLVRDLQHITKLDDNSAASSECMSLFLKCQLLLIKLMKQEQTLPGNSSVATDTIMSTTDKILSMTQRLQHVYLGLGSIELSLVRQTELKARTLQTLSRLGDYQELTIVRDRFNQQLKTLHKYMTTHQITPDSFSTYLFSVLDSLDSCSDTEFRKHLQFSLKSVKACAFPMINKIRKAGVVLHEPTGTSDNPIKFAAGLTSAVAVDATLENIKSPCHVKLRVKYADQQTQLITLSPDAFQRLGQLRHRLQSQVLLSHAPWSDSTHVEISVVLDTPSFSGDQDSKESVIELCKPVKVLVSPKSFKR